MTNRKLAGIWLDTENAIIAKNHNGQDASEFSVCGSAQHEKQHGNSSENTGNNSEQTTKAKFFKEIDHQLENTEELFITGPGTVQEELKNYLLDTPQFKNMKITLDSSQKMNENQLLETVTRHFGV